MTIAAMGFGPPPEFIAIALVFISMIILLFILAIVKWITRRMKWMTICKIVFLLPLIVCLTAVGHKFITSPMKVTKFRLQGTYVINRKMFKGKDTDWQYDHYWIKIKDDVLYLNVMNNGKLIKQYRKPILYSSAMKHTFIRYNHDKTFLIKYPEQLEHVPTNTHINTLELAWDEEHYNSENHHMLTQEPLLNAFPFEFNVVLPSTKYKNMFFIKGKWKNPNRKTKDHFLFRWFHLGTKKH